MNDDVKIYKADQAEALRLSDSALQHLQKYMRKQADCKGVLVTLDTTGCSGLAYVVEMLSAIPEDVWHCQVEGIDLYIPQQHLSKLTGTTLDYVKEGLNEKFIFNNPNESARCGCGESFTIDD